MSWIYNEKPQETNTYLVTIEVINRDGLPSRFKAIAYYDFETDKWYRYDGFQEKSVGEIITEKIPAWSHILPIYAGG